MTAERENPNNGTARRLFSAENILAGALLVLVVAGVGFISRFRQHMQLQEAQWLAFRPPVVNLGRMLQQDEVRPLLELVNRGTNEVRVVGISSTCGCTVMPESLLGEVISAGGTLVIPLVFRAGSGDGPVSAQVQVVGERNRRRETARVQLRGEIVAEFTVEPGHVDFGVLSPGEARERWVLVRPKACTNLVVKSARCAQRGFDVRLAEPADVEHQEAWMLIVRCEAPQSPGRASMSGVAVLETSSQRVPRFEVPLLARIWPEEGVTPRAIVLPEGASGESRVTVETRRVSRIVGVRMDGPHGPMPVGLGDWSCDSADWGHVHVCRVRNEALTTARAVTFEVMVRDASDRTEARSVSVPIRRLQNLN